MSRRPYLRQMPRGWWLRQPRYTAYMVRELTSLFIALYSVFLVLGLVRLAQGSAAFDHFLAAARTPWGIAFQATCLIFAVYHSITWFEVTPKAMPMMLSGEPISGRAIIAAHYVAWLFVSIGVLILAGI